MQDDIALKIENLSKQYRLGLVGTNTLRGDLQSWWHRMRGKEDPTVKIGDENKLAQAGGEYIWALRDINLEVKKGEVLGIIGKNGAGKSTLLKILSRVTGPTTGKVEINGSIASLLEVGTGFHPELTGRENIFLNGAILGMSKAEIRKKIDEIVDFAGVAKYMDTPVKRYSSGMRVRLGFAVAAFLEPDILVVDEVLAVGDAEFQKKAIGKMQDVSKGEGRTVLFVSHNMGSVENLCTKTILLENGKIKKTGETKEVINYYLSSAKESTHTGDLTNVKRKSSEFGTLLKITKCKLINDVVSIDDDLTIEITARATENIKSVSFIVGIENEKEQNIAVVASEEKNQYSDFKKDKPIKTKLIIKSPKLNRGIYSIRVGARQGKQPLDLIENVITLEVHESLMKDRVSANLGGIIRPQSIWEIAD